MMTKLSETPFSPQEALQEAKSLEDELFELLSGRGPLDPRVQQLNNKIRDCYERIILVDHAFAESHDVENAIWNLHYKQIDDLRSWVNRTKSIPTLGDSQGLSGTTISRGGWKSFSEKDSVLEAFKRFIVEASGFYHELILKLRGKYGLPLDFTNGASISGLDESKALELKRYNRSCHKCYVCLGDYARYKEYYASSKPGNFDFSIAAGFYRKAISFWPSIGQPHNQMAVLATYVGDELLATYYYFRSLAVEKPFPTRENLTLLFEQNRLKYHQLTAAAELPVLKQDISKVAKASSDRDPNVAKRNAAQEVSNELINNFRVCFVRLNGILFTKTSLETFEEVCSAAICDLEQLLALDDANLEEVLGSNHCIGMESGNPGAAAALQLISILICTVHNINGGSNGNRSMFTEVFQRALLFKHAITASLEILGRILRRCAETNDISNNPLLPSVLIVLEWLACRPDMALAVEADEKQLNAWSFFWKQCVNLLNNSCYKEKLNGGLRDQMETSLCISSMEDCEIGTALWEDHELQGFSPLAPAHLALDFSKRKFGDMTGSVKEKDARLQRLLAAGKAIVSVLDGSGIGILFDEDLRKFYLVGEVPKKEPYLNALNGGPDIEIHRSTLLSVPNVAVASRERTIPAKALPSKQVSGEDEDEELIVFKPVLKVQPVLTSGVPFDIVVPPHHCSAALDSHVVDSARIKDKPGLVCGMPILKDELPYPNGLARTSNKLASVSDSMTNGSKTYWDSSVIQMACPPRSAYAFSTPGMHCCNENSLNAPMVDKVKNVDPTNFGAFYSPMSRPLSAQGLLNQAGMPSMGSMTGTLSCSVGNVGSQGSKKMSNSAGVIGRPKQFAQNLPEQIHNSPGHALADQCELTSEGLIVAQECCPPLSLPLGIRSLTNGQSTTLKSEKPSEKIANIGSKSATSSRPLVSSVMQPPPGFGPRPINPSVNSMESAAKNQGQQNSLQAGNELQILDDYCWLDDYEPSNLMLNCGGKHQVPPGYSADYNPWCTNISRHVQPEIRAFPFPMMQSSQFSSEKEHMQNSAIWMKEQPLQNPDDKEGWSLFGATIPSDWTSTIFS